MPEIAVAFVAFVKPNLQKNVFSCCLSVCLCDRPLPLAVRRVGQTRRPSDHLLGLASSEGDLRGGGNRVDWIRGPAWRRVGPRASNREAVFVLPVRRVGHLPHGDDRRRRQDLQGRGGNSTLPYFLHFRVETIC